MQIAEVERFRLGTALAPAMAVLVRRCAWHRKYHGYPQIMGVAQWSGWSVSFTDGMCASCADRVRAEFRKPTLAAEPVPRRFRSLRPDFALTAAVVMLAVTVTFGLIIGPPSYDAGAPSAPGVVASTGQPAESGTPPAAPVPPARQAPAPQQRVVAREPAPTVDAPTFASRPVRVARARAVRGTGTGGGGRMATYRPAVALAALEPLVTDDAPARRLDTLPLLLALSDASVQAP